MDWFNTIWEAQVEDYVSGWLNDDGGPSATSQAEIESNTAYLNVFLKSARVVNVRKGLTKFYGTVHSFMSVGHPSSGKAQFNVVTTPAALKNIDSQAVDRVIQINQRLLGPVPYAGGDFEMQVGLFSIASSDLAAPYLGLLESLSKAAGVAFVSTALPFVEPILQGMKLLTGSNKDSILEIGLSMTQDRPRQGRYVVMRAPKQRFAVPELRVDPSDFRLLDKDGSPVTDYPYLILEVSAEAERRDWFNIPELKKAYSDVQELYREESKDIDGALEVFRRIAATCNDLTLQDGKKLAEKVSSMYRTLVAPKEVHRGHQISRTQELPELKEVGLYNR